MTLALGLGLGLTQRGRGIPSWLPRGPDGLAPSFSADWRSDQYWVDGQVAGSVADFLTKAQGTFSRAGAAWEWNAQGDLVSFASGQVRKAYDPDTLEPLGLRLEGQRTNLIPNSRGDGSVIGGALPTGWTRANVGTGALTTKVTDRGVVKGMPFNEIEWQRTGGVGDTAIPYLLFGASHSIWPAVIATLIAIAAALGSAWGAYAYIKHLGRQEVRAQIQKENADAMVKGIEAGRSFDDCVAAGGVYDFRRQRCAGAAPGAR